MAHQNVVYMNTSQLNQTERAQPINYNETYDEAYLTNPNTYEMSIISFRVPNNIPIQVWPGDDFYYITLDYLGTDYTVPLLFDRIDFTSTNQYIETFDQFCAIMNTAFASAFTLAQGGGASQSAAPYITFNPQTDLFTITIGTDYNSGFPIITYFNTNLQLLFNNTFQFQKIGYNRIDKKDNLLLLRDNHQNIVGSNFVLQQELSSINRFYSFQALLFTTNLPINSELINTQSETKTSGLNVIASFYGDIGLDRSDFAYTASDIDSRPIIIQGTQPFRGLSFQCFWVSKDNTVRPVYLNSHESMDLRICFWR